MINTLSIYVRDLINNLSISNYKCKEIKSLSMGNNFIYSSNLLLKEQ